MISFFVFLYCARLGGSEVVHVFSSVHLLVRGLAGDHVQLAPVVGYLAVFGVCARVYFEALGITPCTVARVVFFAVS